MVQSRLVHRILPQVEFTHLNRILPLPLKVNVLFFSNYRLLENRKPTSRLWVFVTSQIKSKFPLSQIVTSSQKTQQSNRSIPTINPNTHNKYIQNYISNDAFAGKENFLSIAMQKNSRFYGIAKSVTGVSPKKERNKYRNWTILPFN